ncbi:MAG: hypothetical protein H6573_05035 [Lewinellaceae bacterium]|nr:hypothetical protein [Lewinellaceae bacterium]
MVKSNSTRKPKTKSKRKQHLTIMLLLGVFAMIIYYSLPLPKGLERNPDGTYSPSPERLSKKENEKQQLDNCEVYKLTAIEDGNYICWNCPTGTIYLKTGMVWRYGYTCNDKRYRKVQLERWGVSYTPFFWGNSTECRKVEKDFIYGYPGLPEYIEVVNLNEIYLLRPPGNKEDD